MKKAHGFDLDQRIKKRNEISFILRSGRRSRRKGFAIIYRPSEQVGDRFAVLVSRKHGNAVARNRIKRRFREVFRHGKGTESPYLDIIIRPDLEEEFNYSGLFDEFFQWRRINGA